MNVILVSLFLVMITGCFTEHSVSNEPSGASSDEPVSSASSAGQRMIDYIDPLVGYEAQVPKGWQRVALDEPGDIGFSVSFESPPSHEQDSFSDYLLVEVLPGQLPEGFPVEPDERTVMQVAGQNVYRERIVLKDYPVGGTTIDLVAWQLKLVQNDYSVGMYVVGEQFNAAQLERILIEFAYSFTLHQSPFTLS